MNSVLEGLSPVSIFSNFEKICSIPHGTGNTNGIREYIINFAKSKNLDYKVDNVGNVVIYKPASYGYEGHETVVLQSHMDMYCDKSFELDGKFDFNKDSLNICLIDDYIFARGTTLGADDGISIAYILSILSDDSLDHPNIEAVFSTDANDNMKGISSFDFSLISGKKIINLDHNIEGEILTSSAGGSKIKCSFDVNTVEHTGIKYNLVVCGLAGGHSGIEIDKQRANANLLIGRFILYIAKRVPIHIAYLKGGLVDTMIPREAKAEIYIDESDIDIVEDAISDFVNIIEKEYSDVEDNLTIYGENLGIDTSLILDSKSQKMVALVLNDLPDGILKMSRNGDDLVQTSSNCGIMRLDRHHFELFIAIRSMSDSEKEALSDKIKYLTEYLNGCFNIEFDYPAWEFNEDSEFRDLAFDTYQRCFEKNPRLTGFHSGLECGFFHKNIPNADIVSFGPKITGCKTTKERLYVPSAIRTYDFLLEILANC